MNHYEDMADQDPIHCENCGNQYPQDSHHCPICGEANPLVTEDLLTDLPETAATPRRWRRNRSGCVIFMLFATFIFLVLAGAVVGGYQGLQERVKKTQAEVDKHYQQALTHLTDNQTELALAELELTLALDPTHTEAREKLQELQATQQATRTPPPTLFTTAADQLPSAEAIFIRAKSLTQQGNWAESIQLFKEIREINPSYQSELVSEAIYDANYELGLRLMTEARLKEAIQAFDEALVERPNDPQVTSEWEKATLYLSLKAIATPSDFEDNLTVLSRIYNLDPYFLDVADRLYSTYKEYGDYLADQKEWCQAYPHYEDALDLSASPNLQELADETKTRCDQNQRVAAAPATLPRQTTSGATSAPRSGATATPAPTATSTPAPPPSQGKIYFSRFNPQSQKWEIIAVEPESGSESVVVVDGTQPSISRSNNLLVYQSQVNSSIGLHVVNLKTGEDVRATTFAEDALPRWTASGRDFIFDTQRAGDRRWQVMVGYADGKGEPTVLFDGRTAAPSVVSNLIAYQGTDVQGNNPGVYVVPRSGGEAQRLTANESDRSPAFSPDHSLIAFMSTRNGNWDIWTVPVKGGEAAVLIATPGNDGLPTWSLDGSQIAFVSDQGGSWGIYVASASGGSPKKVTNWGGGHPDWLIEQLSWGP